MKNYRKKFAVQKKVDPSVVIEEHEGVHPVSYMAHSNLKNICHDSTELLSIMNDEDDLPQWADEMLALAKNNVSKVLGYVRSEKSETNSLKEDDEHPEQLVSKAQQRGFLSSFKETFRRPKSLGEFKMIEIDEKLRSIFLSHGSLNLSLNKDLELASQAINENNFVRAKKHLTDFNTAVLAMSNVAQELVEMPDDRLSEPFTKEAGLFDIFKSKPKPPPAPRNTFLGELFKEFRTLLAIAEHTLETLKSIFKMLDRHRSDRNVYGYITFLESLQNEQKLFSDKFDKAKSDLFMRVEETGQEAMGRSFKEMKRDLFEPKEDRYVGVSGLQPPAQSKNWMQVAPPSVMGQPEFFNPYQDEPFLTPKDQAAMLTVAPKPTSIKKTDECPCGSRLPWLACHGTDIDRIEKIMNDKNVSYEEAERRYFTWVNLYLARQAKIEAEKQLQEEEASEQRKQKYEEFLSQFSPKFYQDETA